MGWYRNLGTSGAGGAAWFVSAPTVIYAGVNLPSVGLNVQWLISLRNGYDHVASSALIG